MRFCNTVKYMLGIMVLNIVPLLLYAQQDTAQVKMRELIANNFLFATRQYKLLIRNVPPEVMPKTYDVQKNKVIASDIKWWCSGFYPGTLLYLYEYSRDTAIMTEAVKRLSILEKEKTYTGNHDLGFMMYCSFGNAYRLTGNALYKAVIMTSAGSLATRYRPSVKAIQSWDASTNFKCPVIIDNMMNLELLEWAGHNGGDKRFEEIAANHANTTLRNHFRPNYSCYHVVDYDPASGQVIKKRTWQGYSDSSSWSRGQSWALYGYTMMYRFTKNKTYLQQAKQVADFILNNRNMPADKVPAWDFDAPDQPEQPKDASAAAIMASALLELGQYTYGKEKTRYINVAEKMLRSLSSSKYRAAYGSNGGFLLMHSTGALPFKSEVDVPLTYADYYFLEALLRYQKWYL